jgi:hypothetical protein
MAGYSGRKTFDSNQPIEIWRWPEVARWPEFALLNPTGMQQFQ